MKPGPVTTLIDLISAAFDRANGIIVKKLNHIEEDVEENSKAISSIQDRVNQLPTLDEIKTLFGFPGDPVAFVVNTQLATLKENEMASTRKATVDLQILENGTVKYTATPVDANQQPTTLPSGTPPLTWASSDPDLVLTSDPADTSGFNLSQIGTAGTTAAAGIVATCSTTLPGASSPITGAAAPVDVVPAPPGSPVGFVVAEA
jgi:hypothetical protein